MRDRIERAARLLGGQPRISRRGVPHIIVDTWRDNLAVSVCYFKRSKTWRVFWPWAPGDYSSGQNQKSRSFRDLSDMALFIEGLPEAIANRGIDLHAQLCNALSREEQQKRKTRKSGRRPSEFRGDISKLRDKLARFEGTPPHDTFDNWCMGDGYYRLSMEEEFGMTLAEIREAVYENSDRPT